MEALRAELEVELGEPITRDGLTGAWSILQRRNGHRHSIDDVLTAAFALEVSPPASAHLDLGTGIGTVGLLVLWGLGGAARLTCVEAQSVSFRLLTANVAGNRLTERVRAIHGDLRELALPERFPLITGSPPYFPPGAGIVPQDSQKAHARFELRGDVSDYARAAARHLTEDGWFVFCFPYAQTARALRAALDAGLAVARVRDVVPRQGLTPLFSLFACRRSEHIAGPHAQDDPFTVRDASGALTDAMQRVRRGFGFGG